MKLRRVPSTACDVGIVTQGQGVPNPKGYASAVHGISRPFWLSGGGRGSGWLGAVVQGRGLVREGPGPVELWRSVRPSVPGRQRGSASPPPPSGGAEILEARTKIFDGPKARKKIWPNVWGGGGVQGWWVGGVGPSPSPPPVVLDC